MKTIFFLLAFFQFISIELDAQQDSLASKDSLPLTTSIITDSIIFNPLQVTAWGPWFCNPEEFKWSYNLVSSINIESPYTPKGAKKDIKAGKPIILFWGGLGGMPDFNSEADKLFQRKYGVQFYSQGCLRTPDDDQEGYNQVIFDYLDKKYGEGWRYELSEGAVGFDKLEKPKISICAIPDVITPLAMQLANPGKIGSESVNPETETSVWWYVLPTSGFALLLSLYFIKKRKD